MDIYATHLPLLVAAVTHTAGPVLELGIGNYSTLLLHELCRSRTLVTLEMSTEREWLEKYYDLRTDGHVIEPVEHWAECKWLDRDWGVAFIDHKPGEERVDTIARLANRAQIIVVHDTEEGGYKYEPILSRFQYRYDYKRMRPWTSAVSNFCPIPKVG
jgi:predicted O-methyltransferase YrrM